MPRNGSQLEIADQGKVGMNCNLRVFGSPLGWILAAVQDDGALIRLEFVGPRQIERMIERLQQSGYSLNWNTKALRDVVIRSQSISLASAARSI